MLCSFQQNKKKRHSLTQTCDRLKVAIESLFLLVSVEINTTLHNHQMSLHVASLHIQQVAKVIEQWPHLTCIYRLYGTMGEIFPHSLTSRRRGSGPPTHLSLRSTRVFTTNRTDKETDRHITLQEHWLQQSASDVLNAAQ